MRWCSLLICAGLCTAVPQPLERFTLDPSAAKESISRNLFGHNLEFTRHDLWEGLSAEMLANRKFAVSPSDSARTTDSIPRWDLIGPAVVDAGTVLAESLLSRSVRCDGKSPCGVSQTGMGAGYDSGQASGSAICPRKGTNYTFRVAIKATGPRVVAVTLTAPESPGAPLLNHTFDVDATGDGWLDFAVNFTAPVTTDNATLSVVALSGGSSTWLGAVSMVPAAAAGGGAWPRGVRPDVASALKNTGFRGLLRFPGGCFAPFYDWERDNAANPDARPAIPVPLKNYCAAVPGGVAAYTDGLVETGVNTREYVQLARALEMRTAITFPLQYGSADEVASAARWAAWCARNGYDIAVWFIGNEIAAQTRFPDFPNSTEHEGPIDAAGFAKAMRATVSAVLEQVPESKFIASGTDLGGTEAWTRSWLSAVGSSSPAVTASSFHGGYHTADPKTPDEFAAVAKYPTNSFVDDLRTLRANLDAAANGTGTGPAVSLDEWGLGPPWTVREFGVAHAMYAAQFLASIARNAKALRIGYAAYFEPINEGALRVRPFADPGTPDAGGTKSGVSMTPVGLAMSMYSQHQDRRRLDVADAPEANANLDVLASSARGPQGTTSLLVHVANRNATTPSDAHIVFRCKPSGDQTADVTWAEPSPGPVPTPESVFATRTSSVPLHVTPDAKALAINVTIPAYSIVEVELAQCVERSD